MNEKYHARCEEFPGALSEYIDGELDPVFCQELESHMSHCANCRIVVDTMKKTILLYQQEDASNVKIPGEIRARLFKKLILDDYLDYSQDDRRKK